MDDGGQAGDVVAGALRGGQDAVEELKCAEQEGEAGDEDDRIGEGVAEGVDGRTVDVVVEGGERGGGADRDAVEPAPMKCGGAEEGDGDPGGDGDEEGDDADVDAIGQALPAPVVDEADGENDEGRAEAGADDLGEGFGLGEDAGIEQGEGGGGNGGTAEDDVGAYPAEADEVEHAASVEEVEQVGEGGRAGDEETQGKDEEQYGERGGE